MSADNGYILRRNSDEKFVLQYYNASMDEFPKIEDANPTEKFNELWSAINMYETLEDTLGPTEYRLTVKIRKVTPKSGE